MSEDQRRRRTKSNLGQIFGGLDGMLPFLYLAQNGAHWSELNGAKSDSRAGLFAIGEATGGPQPGILVHIGLILPVSLCRNPTTRSTLASLPDLIDTLQDLPVSEQRRIAQASVDEAFGGTLTINRRDHLSPYLKLDPTPMFFERLQAEFDYVLEVLDDPDGTASVTRSAPFAWRSYGELMEWYNAREDQWLGPWQPFTPFLVSGGTALMRDSRSDRLACAGMNRPVEAPSRWFVIRPDLQDAPVTTRLELLDHGWGHLYVTLGDETAKITLSEVFNPFPQLVEWGSRIESGDLPIEMEIDEEGEEVVMTVLCTEDSERVLFRVTRRWAENLHLEGVVSRAALAGTFKSELRRFFASEYDPVRWEDTYRMEEPEYIPTDAVVLNHPWIASTT